jgi:hypothetical protein
MEDVEMNKKMANFYSYHQDRVQDRSIHHCYRLPQVLIRKRVRLKKYKS